VAAALFGIADQLLEAALDQPAALDAEVSSQSAGP